MLRSLFTSTLAKKTSSCFSARLFLRISSVSTVQKQICARNYPKILVFRETMEFPAGLSIAGSHTSEQQQGNLVQDNERRFEHLSDDQKLPKLCSDAEILEPVETGQQFFTLDTEEGLQMQHFMPRIHDASKRKEDWSEMIYSRE